jgi:hypothetical protein
MGFDWWRAAVAAGDDELIATAVNLLEGDDDE